MRRCNPARRAPISERDYYVLVSVLKDMPHDSIMTLRGVHIHRLPVIEAYNAVAPDGEILRGNSDRIATFIHFHGVKEKAKPRKAAPRRSNPKAMTKAAATRAFRRDVMPYVVRKYGRSAAAMRQAGAGLF